MGRLQELISRKATADALPDETRAKYAEAYTELCDQIHGKLIELTFACENYTKVFITDVDDLDALIEAARKIIGITGGITP